MQRPNETEANEDITILKKQIAILNEEIAILSDLANNHDGEITDECITSNQHKRLTKILTRGPCILEDYRQKFDNYTRTYLPIEWWFTKAARLQHWECVDALARHAINRFERNYENKPYQAALEIFRRDAAEALGLAANSNKETTVKTLLEIPFIIRQHPTRLLLHCAISNNNIDMFLSLLTKMIKNSKKTIFLKNTDGMTAFEYTISKGVENTFAEKLAEAYDDEEMCKELKTMQAQNLLFLLYNEHLKSTTHFPVNRRKEVFDQILLLSDDKKKLALDIAIDPKTQLGSFLASDHKFRQKIAEEHGKMLLSEDTLLLINDPPSTVKNFSAKAKKRGYPNLYTDRPDGSEELEPFLETSLESNRMI